MIPGVLVVGAARNGALAERERNDATRLKEDST